MSPDRKKTPKTKPVDPGKDEFKEWSRKRPAPKRTTEAAVPEPPKRAGKRHGGGSGAKGGSDA